jgi:hypothetical protein
MWVAPPHVPEEVRLAVSLGVSGSIHFGGLIPPHRACIRNPVRVSLGCGHSISVFRRCRAEAA